MSDEDFYDAQSEASQIKTRIVTKYFMFWAKVMVPQARSWARALAYIDLYAGPGRYDDGTKSTPILVLEAAVQNPDLRKFLVTTFNDRNPEFATRLRSNIQKIAGIESLAHQPQVHSVEVDEEVADVFGRAALIPSFSFVEATWNPIAGCKVISPGCTNCYAMRMASRLAAMGQKKYQGTTRKSGGRSKWNGEIRLDFSALDIPRRWTKGKLIFVNSMSDLFHDDVPLPFIKKVFQTMNETPHHTYQVLTKRADRVRDLSSQIEWTPNIWMGVSVENADYQWRIDCLQQTGASTKFLSLEPLLGPLDDLDLTNIDWVIVGGESGPGARPMLKKWVRSIRDQCITSDVAFHFKQWGGVNKKRTGRTLDGRTWDELPDAPKTKRSEAVSPNRANEVVSPSGSPKRKIRA